MVLLCSLLLSAAPATQVPVEDTELLTLYIADAQTFFADPKDAGLLEALRMIEARVGELPGEIDGFLHLPPELISLAAGLLTSEKSLRIGRSDSADNPLGVCASLEVMEGDEAAAKRLARNLENLGHMLGVSFGSVREDGLIPVQVPDLGEVVFGPQGESVILSMGTTVDRSFDLSATGLPSGADVLLLAHLNVGAFFEMSLMDQSGGDPQVAAELGQLISSWGLDEMVLDVAVGAEGDRSYTIARLPGHARRARDHGLMPRRPLRASDLDLIPADAIFAGISAVNPEGSLDYQLEFMRADLEQMGLSDPIGALEAVLGVHIREDLVAHMGDVIGWYTSDTTGGGGVPSMIGFLELSDPEGMLSTLEQLEDMLNTLGVTGGDGYVGARTWSRGETQFTTLVFPGLPVPFEPTYAVADNYLLIGLSPSAVVAAVAEAAKPGGLSSHPSFVENLPHELGACYSISYADNSRLVREGYGFMTLLCSALVNSTRSPVDPGRDAGMILPTLPELLQGAKASIWCSYLDGDDWVYEQRGNRSILVNLAGVVGSVLNSPLAVLAFVGVVAGMDEIFDPWFVEREQSGWQPVEVRPRPRTAVIADLRALDEAVTMYVMQNQGHLPHALHELVEEDVNGNTYLKQKSIPKDPWGVEYRYETLGGTKYRIWTYGADNAPGGRGENRDRDSEMLGNL